MQFKIFAFFLKQFSNSMIHAKWKHIYIKGSSEEHSRRLKFLSEFKGTKNVMQSFNANRIASHAHLFVCLLEPMQNRKCEKATKKSCF